MQPKKEEAVLDIFASPFQRQTAAAAPAAITPTTAAAATFLGLVRTQPIPAFDSSKHNLPGSEKRLALCVRRGPPRLRLVVPPLPTPPPPPPQAPQRRRTSSTSRRTG